MTTTYTIGEFPWLDPAEIEARPAVRVIVDNDFAGDPDDLIQLAHHLLSPSVEIVAVISSHLAKDDPFMPDMDRASDAGLEKVLQLFEIMGCDPDGRALLGTRHAIVDANTPQSSPGVDAIIAAARADDDRPLYVVCGGGLTDPASALLAAPDIADKLTIVWIGGPEYPELSEPAPGNPTPEYNLNIDITAAQVVTRSTVQFWQVPRDAYREAICSFAELRARLRPAGPLGAHLYAELARVHAMVGPILGGRRETYVLGDSPLVTLTALCTVFEPFPESSQSVLTPVTLLADDGSISGYGREVRVFTNIDYRLTFEDLWAKLAEFAAWQAAN